MRGMVYAHEVNMGEELLWEILSSVGICISKATALCNFVCFLVRRVRKCIHAGGGNFQQIV